MIRQTATTPRPAAGNQSAAGAEPEKIVIVIEQGKIVWFDTAGKLPPGD